MPADRMEEMAARELDQAPPLCVVFPTAMKVQAVRLPGGGPGVGLELSNAVYKVPFAMDLDQARQHINNVEQAILETRPVQMERREEEPVT